MRPALRPWLEALEDRLALSGGVPGPQLEGGEDHPPVFGGSWPDPWHLTLSFALDGTAMAGRQSSLASWLDLQLGPGVWERDVLRAYQSWLQFVNVNVGVVADSGLPSGATGAVQGDARFGDIRVAGLPMSGEVLGVG
jgi:hypothetical protein